MMKMDLVVDVDGREPLTERYDAAALPEATPRIRERLADYLELTKPRIAVMALFTVAAGFVLGSGGSIDYKALVHTLIGAGLVAAGGSTLNHLIERRIDSRMRRTANRPLPSGRLSPEQAAAFGATLSGAGLAYLLATVPAAGFLAAAATFLTYVLVYTPLKTVTEWNTIVGAVPGALPPVIGWCSARGWSGIEGAAALFAILFVWQIPHFLAIAWMYREDYAGAGFRMLPGSDAFGRKTSFVMIAFTAFLVPIGFIAFAAGLGGWASAIGAALAGAYFLRRAVGFGLERTDLRAKRVLRASLLYLPIVFGLLLLSSGCGVAARTDSQKSSSSSSSSPDLDFPVGHFSLTERGGRTVTDQDLHGSVWVASFVFTRCTGPCPQVTATIARLQQELKTEPGVKFVTFTVDPKNDDMKKLRDYASHFNADPERWLFLTGDEATIHKLMREQFKQAIEKKTGAEVKPGDEFGHSTRLALVDKQGIIRGFFDGVQNEEYPDGKSMFEENLKRLEDRARELARQ
jgi:protoheme IX farnesyltransferase